MFVCLKSRQNTFLNACEGGSDARIEQWLLVANKKERFYVEKRSNGKFTLRTCHGTYMRAGSKGELNQAASPREWEEFEFIYLAKHNKWNIRTFHGGFIRAQPVYLGYQVDHRKGNEHDWNQFEIIDVTEVPKSPYASICPFDGTVFIAYTGLPSKSKKFFIGSADVTGTEKEHPKDDTSSNNKIGNTIDSVHQQDDSGGGDSEVTSPTIIVSTDENYVIANSLRIQKFS